MLSIERDGRVLRRRSAALFCLLKSMAIIKALVNRQSPELQKLALQFTKYHASVDSPTQAESRVMQGRIRDRMSGRLGAVMTITRSGNQGVFLGMPLSRLYSANGRRALPSILFTLLTQIHLNQRKGRVSYRCMHTRTQPTLNFARMRLLATKAAYAMAVGSVQLALPATLRATTAPRRVSMAPLSFAESSFRAALFARCSP